MADVANGFGQRHSRRKGGASTRCHSGIERIGRTSMVIPVEVWVRRYMHGKQIRVTHGVFTHVAVDESGKPIPVKRETA